MSAATKPEQRQPISWVRGIDLELLQPVTALCNEEDAVVNISEATVACGLSADTIRYYERCGMLPEIKRGPNGHRDFSPTDLEWLTLLYWLRESGMSMEQMKRFTFLAKAGEAGLSERRRILMDHAVELKRRRALLDRCENVLAIKIASYDLHEDPNEVRLSD